MHKAVLIAAMLLGSSQARAASDFAAMGFGIDTCGVFAQNYRQAPDTFEMTYFHWAQGFMAGLNVARMATNEKTQNLASITVPDQKRHIRTYCSNNPLSDYSSAVINLYWKFTPSAFSPK